MKKNNKKENNKKINLNIKKLKEEILNGSLFNMGIKDQQIFTDIIN